MLDRVHAAALADRLRSAGYTLEEVTDRLGADAADWGSYYDSRPIVVAGRIALALEMVKRHG